MKISIKEPTLLLKKLCKDKDKISIATKPEESLMAGETAMGHYTMLAEPATPVIAIDKATARKNAAIMNKEYGDIKVEVWKYSPALLSEDEWADRLSLYLCMKIRY